MEEFRKTMQLTLEDYYEFNQTYINRFRRGEGRFRTIYGALIFAVLFGVMACFMKVEQAQVGFVIFMAIFGFVGGLLITLLAKGLSRLFRKDYLSRPAVKKLYKKSGDLQRGYTLTINDRGIESRTDEAGSFVIWSRVVRVLESEKGFYLFVNNRAAFMIPKRYLDSQEEESFIRQQIATNVAPKKVKYIALEVPLRGAAKIK